jgi:hypothetical protein
MAIERTDEMPELEPLRQDIVPPAGLFDRAEASVFARIERFERDNGRNNDAASWEAVIAAGESVPESIIDAAEKKLFDRIADAARPASKTISAETTAGKPFLIVFPALFTIIPEALGKKRTLVALLFIAATVTAGFMGWNRFAAQYIPLQTVAMSSLLTGAKVEKSVVHESETVSSGTNRRIVLSNRHGTVVLENRASVVCRRARLNRMDYAVSFADYSPASRGRVIFSVTKAKRGREFTASTRDYAVHVVGTVFMLTPQERGRCAVRVIEGMVRIEGPGVSAVVSAGNAFGFDDQAGAYVSKSSLATQTDEIVPQTPQDTTAVGLKPKPRFRFVARNVPLSRDSLLDRASGLEATDWEQSIQTYRAILDRPGVSQSCREIALFSIGRLLADHNAPAASARDAFITYLKQFPKGSFCGETYLRLADLEYRNDPAKALEWYEKYLQEFPAAENTAVAEYKVGLIYLEKKKNAKAVGMLSSALRHAKNYSPDLVAAIQRVLDNARNPVTAAGALPAK